MSRVTETVFADTSTVFCWCICLVVIFKIHFDRSYFLRGSIKMNSLFKRLNIRRHTFRFPPSTPWWHDNMPPLSSAFKLLARLFPLSSCKKHNPCVFVLEKVCCVHVLPRFQDRNYSLIIRPHVLVWFSILIFWKLHTRHINTPHCHADTDIPFIFII